MGNRGDNNVSKTVQIWDGIKWIPFDNLRLDTTIVGTSETLWVPSATKEIGYTGDHDLRESLTHVLDNQIVGATPFFAEKKLLVAVANVNEAPVDYVLPVTVNGVSPVGKSQAKLVAQISVSVTRDDGSDYSVSEYTAWWPYVAGTYSSAAGGIVLNQSGTPVPGVVVTISVSGGAAVLSFSCPGLADHPKYLADIDLKLCGYL